MLQRETIAQQVGDAFLKAVELGQTVVAQRDQETDIDIVAVDGARELRLERLRVRRFRMIKKVLFELVQQDQNRFVGGLGASPQDLIERQGLGRFWLVDIVLPHRHDTSPTERHLEFPVDPVAENNDRSSRPLAAQLRHDPRPQHRTLADAARSVKKRERRSQQIGDDDALVALATEKELAIRLLERL